MSASSGRTGAGPVIRITLALLLATTAAGCVPWELSQVLDGPQGKALSISPSTTVLPGGGTVVFAAGGGVPPYRYTMASGLGSVDPATGFFTASATPGPAVVRVIDRTGKYLDATIAVQTSGPLAISPSTVSVVAGGTLTFFPIGGSGSYSFSMSVLGSGSGSPSPSVTSGGVYVAGPSPGTTDKVRLTDTVTSTYVEATVTVTAAASAVNYTVSSVSGLPVSGTVSSGVPAGTFTLQNTGTGNGQQPVTWELYLSQDTTLGGGDWLLGSGTDPGGPLIAGASHSVSVTGNFPAVSPGVWNLIVHVSAADDTTPADNTSSASPITLSAQSIDYSIPAPGPTSVFGTLAGAAVSGNFTIHNGGSADGVASIQWAVYASTDATLDASDYLVARGTTTPVTHGVTSGAISFNGYWPAAPGPWYLLATVSAPDDVSSLNNTMASGSTFTTTGPPPLNIDYTVQNVISAAGTAGDPLTGTFRIHNGMADTGAQPVSWTAYLSSDATLNVGIDAVIDSGSVSAVAGNSTSGTITFHGNWPTTPGPWYLIVAVSSSEDTDPSNNNAASGSFSPTAPDVNYTVTSVGGVVGTTAGATFTGSLTIQNVGTHAGTQFVPWSVYRSADAVLNVGTDQLVATGFIPNPGLGIGGTSTPSFGGTWPASTSSNSYYLIAVVGAGDDVASGNNTTPSSSITVNPPNVDYKVTSVHNVVGTTAGGPFSAQFDFQNIGTAAGAAGVNWTAYISSDATLDVTDTAFQTGSFSGQPAGQQVLNTALAGTWPAGAAIRYIIVKVSAADDVNPGNDTGSTAVPVTIPAYTISVPNPVAGTAGQPVAGTFTIQNTSTADGTATINWTVYASLGNSTWDAGDTVIQSGTTGGLTAGTPASPGYSGTWPTAAGSYWIIVRATAADASGTATGVTGASTTVAAPNVDYIVVPGSVTGTMAPPVAPATPASGSFQYKNQGLNNGSQWVNWTVYASPNPTLDSYAISIASGMAAPLNAGQPSASIPFSGTWPLVYNNYYLLVSLSVQEDANPGNNTGASAATTPVGIYTGIVQNGTFTPWAGYTDLTGVVLQPGMSVIVHMASMPSTNTDHTFLFNTGTANAFTATWSLDVPMLPPPATNPPDLGIYYYTSGATFDAVQSYGLLKVNSISVRFVPDAQNVARLLDLYNARPKNITSYTLIITAN